MSVCPNVTSEKIINTYHYTFPSRRHTKTSWDNFNFVRSRLNLAHGISKCRNTYYSDCLHQNRKPSVVFIPTHEIKIQQKLSWHRYAFYTFCDHNAIPHFRTKERVLNWHIDILLTVSTVSLLFVTILPYLILKHHCATSRKVAGWIPHWLIAIIHCFNPFGRSMALESTEPLTEVSTRSISWGLKAVGA
jgi:hypothetical protein